MKDGIRPTTVIAPFSAPIAKPKNRVITIAATSGTPLTIKQPANHAGKAIKRSNRQIDFRDNQDVCGADRENAEQGNLSEQIENICAGQENMTHQRKDGAKNQQAPRIRRPRA